MRNKRGIHVYTDGGARPNPGNGAYAWVAIDTELDQFIEQKAQKIYDTTNNICEMTAVYSVLLAVVQNSWEDVVIYTDSQYVHKGLTIWAEGWERKNFSGVKNADLWRGMYALYKQLYYKVKIEWVKGHAGNIWNEYVDELVTATILGKGQSSVRVEVEKPVKAKPVKTKDIQIGAKAKVVARKQAKEGIQEHIERYDELPSDEVWDELTKREWTPELVQQFNEHKVIEPIMPDKEWPTLIELANSIHYLKKADDLLVAVYREMHKDAFLTGSHGLRTNITEYLQSRKLI